MQRSSDIIGYSLRAKDGAIGSITDILFDDRHFGLRWVVIDTGTWLPGRKVLLPPTALGTPDPATREYPVDLTLSEIEDAPGLETDQPVSRQLETDIYGFYGWHPYWYGGYGYAMVGGVQPAGLTPGQTVDRQQAKLAQEQQKGDGHLHSVEEVTGYYVEATDDNIGHIEDFVIDESSWAVRYLVIDTKNWWPGKMVLISPDWLRGIAWTDGKVHVGVTRDKVKDSPEFDPSTTIDRKYEESIHAHYGYTPYWVGWA
ncbi:PRC-barrel domain-containing protein [Sulfitobacter sp. DFL-23]|uniref:PRC-barrel domain-containing protein n=1 Tax=Sulfitobacter sp. DFL-23 TaxID=215829 RepID=UPI000DF3796D|nr:PRC-barrel domain-containing protein [Sulfitobacter sp. DFL-23]